MNRKFVITFLMLAVTVLSACSGQNLTPIAQNTVPPTIGISSPQATFTTQPTLTAGPTVTGEPSSTAITQQMTATSAPPRPTNAPDCTNSASFVADVTLPDHTEIQGGDTFTKTWRIMNTGTCVWAADYTLTPYSEERMNAPAVVPLPLTFPNQTADISVQLTAPNSVGSHRGNFVIKNPAGLIMKVNDDSRLWLIIDVKNTVAATAAPTLQTGAATPTTANVAPTNTAGASGAGLANPTCAFTIDQAKLIEMLNAINAYRGQSGMSPYNVNPQLARAAQTHAGDMACNQLTGDNGSNGSTVQARIAAAGYTASFSDENTFNSNPPISGQDVVNKWVNDTANNHQKLNLVSDTYIEIGIGYAFFNNTGYYVIVFATP
jgi:uncharacterized protein YkwD